MTIELWVHVAELVLVGIFAPGVKKLVTVLYALSLSTDRLTTSLDQHARAFNEHVIEDRNHFKELDEGVSETNGNIRELMGLMRLERRTGLERRGDA